MLISYQEPRFLFIHVYKAAGNSIASALDPYGQRTPRDSIFHPDHTQHVSARSLKAALPGEVWASCFRFAFVRNPWDRLLSLYQFILAKPRNRDHQLVRSLGDLDGFIDWMCSPRDPEIPIKRTQSDFLVDDRGELLVDFVGRFEHLARDFAQVCARLGVSAELGHLNASPHAAYATAYTATARQRVADWFADEIERFGYRF